MTENQPPMAQTQQIGTLQQRQAAQAQQGARPQPTRVQQLPSPRPGDNRIEDLMRWWVAQATDDVQQVAEKAVTYGSNSLEQLGRKMAQLNGRRNIGKDEALELGCWVYMTGKIERWTDAVMRGERPGDDTILDIMNYAMMTRRIRQAGGWPDQLG